MIWIMTLLPYLIIFGAMFIFFMIMTNQAAANAGGGYGIYQSTDKGVTWKRINDDTQKWGNVRKIISGDPKVYGRVYVGTDGRGIIMGNVKQ